MNVRQAKAIINEPTGGSETALKCLAGLVLGIRMDAELFNIPDPSQIRICVRTADQVNHLFNLLSSILLQFLHFNLLLFYISYFFKILN